MGSNSERETVRIRELDGCVKRKDRGGMASITVVKNRRTLNLWRLIWMGLVEAATVWKAGGVCHEWKESFWTHIEKEIML